MQTKLFYASIELAEDEIRFVVGEFFMSRFNVLKVERVKVTGIKNNRIIDQDSVSATIVKSLYDIEKALGLKVKSVVLCIPDLMSKRAKCKVSVPIEEGSKRIRMSHVKKGLEKAVESNRFDDFEFVNVGSIKYMMEGIASRTIPINEQADCLTMEVELLYGNKEIVYSYVSCIEASGLNVLDICMDTFAIAEESAILESSMEHYIVLLYFEKNRTTLSLFHKGLLVGSEDLGYGYQKWVDAIRRSYHLSQKECLALVRESALNNTRDLNDAIVYMWTENEQAQSITRKNLFDAIDVDIKTWIKDINLVNEDIINSGNAKMVISGSGADILGLQNVTDDFGMDCSIYLPTTIGVRSGCYSAVLGAVYVHRKWEELSVAQTQSVSALAQEKRIQTKDDDNSFTRKLKHILLNK